ncbi:hypothetical protein ACNKHX_03515 [Shigella flexneri]
MKAYSLLEQLRSGSTDQAVCDQFRAGRKTSVTVCCSNAIRQTWLMRPSADSTGNQRLISRVAPLAFRVLYHGGVWLLLLAIIALCIWSVIRNRIGEKDRLRAPRCTVFRCRGLL